MKWINMMFCFCLVAASCGGHNDAETPPTNVVVSNDARGYGEFIWGDRKSKVVSALAMKDFRIEEIDGRIEHDLLLSVRESYPYIVKRRFFFHHDSLSSTQLHFSDAYFPENIETLFVYYRRELIQKYGEPEYDTTYPAKYGMRSLKWEFPSTEIGLIRLLMPATEFSEPTSTISVSYRSREFEERRRLRREENQRTAL